jgi:hypothetical protein
MFRSIQNERFNFALIISYKPFIYSGAQASGISSSEFFQLELKFVNGTKHITRFETKDDLLRVVRELDEMLLM